MKTKTPRCLALVAALATAAGAGVFTANAWIAPPQGDGAGERSAAALAEPASDEPKLLLRRGSNPNGALLQNLRRYQSRTARLEETPPAHAAGDLEQVRPAPALTGAFTPLPPARPIELSSPPADAVAALPLPPTRPKELAAAPAEPRAPAPSTIAEETQPVRAATQPLAYAALSTPDLPSPLRRREDGSFRMGAPAYVRIFKKEGELELWLKRNGRYSLYKTYPICKWSGHLGPKLRSGDYQSPEGFYSVSARQLNPNSAYHRAFNIGFPNAFDRQNGRTGGALMVHGACKSVGCFAMTDKVIEEIYGFVEAAIRGGQHEVPVHIFPFRMTEEAFARETKGDWTTLWSAPSNHHQWASFWANLKEGYDLFEQTSEPPTAFACGRRYAFGRAGTSCTRIAGW
jgi:murein L,D-transpeptidase YafK